MLLDVRTYRVIYQAVQDIESAARGMLGPEVREVALGQAEVRATFRVPKLGVVAVVLNFTPVPRDGYRIGVPRPGHWKEILNSDAGRYGGSNRGNMGGVDAVPVPLHGRSHSLTLSLPPLGVVFLKK